MPIIEDITITPHELGRGSYGTVYAAEYNGKPCVAKEMHPFLSQFVDKYGSLEVCYKEINTLSTLKHPSIVQFLGVYFRENSEVPILVMEKMWKSLSTIVEDKMEQLPLLIKTHILYDVACGLQYLHGQKKPVIHRDLSANNVLVTEHLRAKIADLGQAKTLKSIKTQKLSTAPGNVLHMAPEALQHGSPYDFKIDIFSFGCTVLHLVTEELPCTTEKFVQSANNTFMQVSEADRRKKFIDLVASRSSVLHHIAIQCLDNKPTSRPDAVYIRNELKKYTQVQEADPVNTDSQYKLDILSLLKVIKSQEDQIQEKEKVITQLKDEGDLNKAMLVQKDEYMEILQQDFAAVKSKLEQTEIVQHSAKQDNESLLMETTKQLTEKDKKIQELKSETLQLANIFSAERKSLELEMFLLQQELSLYKKEALSSKQSKPLLQKGAVTFICDSTIMPWLSYRCR